MPALRATALTSFVLYSGSAKIARTCAARARSINCARWRGARFAARHFFDRAQRTQTEARVVVQPRVVEDDHRRGSRGGIVASCCADARRRARRDARRAPPRSRDTSRHRPDRRRSCRRASRRRSGARTPDRATDAGSRRRSASRALQSTTRVRAAADRSIGASHDSRPGAVLDDQAGPLHPHDVGRCRLIGFGRGADRQQRGDLGPPVADVGRQRSEEGGGRQNLQRLSRHRRCGHHDREKQNQSRPEHPEGRSLLRTEFSFSISRWWRRIELWSCWRLTRIRWWRFAGISGLNPACRASPLE